MDAAHTFYFGCDYAEWDRWTAPGLELPAETGMLTVRLSPDPGGLSTVQVGSYGHIYGPEVPLTPAMLAAILQGASVESGGLYFIDPKYAATWLDPYEEPKPDPDWKPPAPLARGVYSAEPREGGDMWLCTVTSTGERRPWYVPGGADLKGARAELWRQLDYMDPPA